MEGERAVTAQRCARMRRLPRPNPRVRSIKGLIDAIASPRLLKAAEPSFPSRNSRRISGSRRVIGNASNSCAVHSPITQPDLVRPRAAKTRLPSVASKLVFELVTSIAEPAAGLRIVRRPAGPFSGKIISITWPRPEAGSGDCLTTANPSASEWLNNSRATVAGVSVDPAGNRQSARAGVESPRKAATRTAPHFKGMIVADPSGKGDLPYDHGSGRLSNRPDSSGSP
jgi:hypothetical protein